MKKDAAYYIYELGLTAHVEGGAFRETYRSELLLPENVIGKNFNGSRNASTAIYFLLQYGQISALHRIAADEMWHFYDGDVLTIYEIDKHGVLHVHKLGRSIEKGERFQILIPAGSWFGSRCEVPGGFSLVGCTVAPGFDFGDFELADRAVFIEKYPAHEQLVFELTY